MIKKKKVNGKEFWELRARLGGRDGNETQVKRRFKTEKEAKFTYMRLMQQVEEKKRLDEKGITFKDFSIIWIKSYADQVKPSTLKVSKRYLENFILPTFGNCLLHDITIEDCQTAVDEWKQRSKQFLKIKREMQRILEYAIYLERIEKNPMKRVIVPKTPAAKTTPIFSSEQLIRFLDFSEEKCTLDKFTYFHLLAFTGIRRSEAFALSWSDIDLDKGTLSISKSVSIDEKDHPVISTPKTESSNRIIYLDDLTVKVLSEWKSMQTQKYYVTENIYDISEKLVFSSRNERLYHPNTANGWLNSIYSDYDKAHQKDYQKIHDEIVALEEATNLENFNQLSREIEIKKKYLKDLKLPRISPHGFRHTHGSLLNEFGELPKSIQIRLGHSSIKTTFDFYVKLSDETKADTSRNFLKNINLKKDLEKDQED